MGCTHHAAHARSVQTAKVQFWNAMLPYTSQLASQLCNGIRCVLSAVDLEC